MPTNVLVAGIGNIFQGDDAFGVAVVQKLQAIPFPEHTRVVDVGIRSIDLAFALLDDYDLTILVDATARGGAPGTLYTIEIEANDIPDLNDETSLVNGHGMDPVSILSSAKGMGARFGRLLLVGCEPLVVDHDESGHIGLSEVVHAAVELAVHRIRELVHQFEADKTKKEEVCSQ